MKALTNKIALVTGASRGVGKGIALSLAQAGARVYITGRTTEEGESASKLSGNIYQTAKEIADIGGECVAIQCDHLEDAQVESVVDKLSRTELR
jgi:dehydrogenase/reductase SDR family protein 1